MVKRKDGRYQQTVTINGKTKYFYGMSKAEVFRKIREYKEEQEKGALFSAVADEWWDEHEPTLSPNSAKSYLPAKNRAIRRFGAYPIKDITPMLVSAFVADFVKEGYAQKTVNTQLMVLSLIFKFSVSHGYSLYNPARDIERPKNLRKTKRNAAPKSDIQIIKDNADTEIGLLAFMALYTGLRRGELLALTWDDIDIEKRTISVTKSLYHQNNNPFIKEPKTKESIGVVPILDALLPHLHKGKGVVFHNEKGEYLTAREFKIMWEKYKNQTGIKSTLHQ